MSSAATDALELARALIQRPSVTPRDEGALGVLETALICTQQALPLRELRTLFNDAIGADTVKQLPGLPKCFRGSR